MAISYVHEDMVFVIYNGCSSDQARYGGCDDPRGILRTGEEYEVEHEDVRAWHTKVKLKDIKGRFNSVCFTPSPRSTLWQVVEDIIEQRRK